jgi:hypothetical protein
MSKLKKTTTIVARATINNHYSIFLQKLTTSRKKAIPGAPKLLIAGAFWFAGDLHTGGNAYRCRIFQFASDKKIIAGAFGICARITFYPWRISNRCVGDNILSLAN